MSTSTDCNTNGTLDSCEIAELVVADCNGNGLPDECEGLVPRPPSPETPPTPKNRFLSFTPANPTLVTAIRVTFTQLPSPYDQFNDRIMWVGMPRMISEAPGSVDPSPGSSSFAASTLQCEPLFRNWSDTDLLHVYHEFIVPGGTYDFQVITDACDVALGSSYSAALALSTSSWGDVVGDFEPSVGRWSAPDGKVAVPSDIVASLDGFANKVGAPHKTRVDLEPGVVDLTINITDVTFALDAFSGQAYPFQPQSSPCP